MKIDRTSPSAQLEQMVGNNGIYLIDPMVIGSMQSHRDSKVWQMLLVQDGGEFYII